MPAASPFNPIAEAIADAEGVPEAFTEAFQARHDDKQPRDLVIICYSGDLEKTWASLILASTAAASGVPTKMFLTFWGLQAFVKDDVRITGQGWMQKMLSVMQRPGISHRKLSKMNFLGMGPWMMGTLAKQYGVAKPKELLEAAIALGVEFMPCQMTMDMFGLEREDMIEGMGEPVGAATVIELLANGAAPLFI
ncbi:MAG TPA: DsrE/DsrF/DrsH-like family protein [Candidatus Dormibacteraeota bacterium]|nr:DsrE/DsrF/DrsH-like family protein [Candidatus Dormibacteraeota bacterium]